MVGAGGLLYAIGIEGSTLVKIGCTHGPVETRLRALQISQPHPLFVVASVPVSGNMRHVEQQLHRTLAAHHQRGEWFDIVLDASTFTALVEEAGAILVAPWKMSGPTLGQHLKIARIRKGLQQQQVATDARMSQKHLSQIEKDHVSPGWDIMVRLALLLDLDLNALAREGHGHAAHVG